MRLLTPPSTLSQQKQAGYLLIGAAIVLTVGFTALAVAQSDPWMRLVPVYLVMGTIAVAGAWQVVAARRGRLRFDERRRRRHFRAGYRAFWTLFIVVGSDATFGLLEGTPHWIYLWIGLLTFFASLAYDKRRH